MRLLYNDFVNDYCFFFLGGYDGKKYLNTTQIIYPNGTKTEGPELPESRDGHCLVEYAGIIISMGGQYVTYNGQFWSNTLYYNAFLTYYASQSAKFRPEKLSNAQSNQPV